MNCKKNKMKKWEYRDKKKKKSRFKKNLFQNHSKNISIIEVSGVQRQLNDGFFWWTNSAIWKYFNCKSSGQLRYRN